MNLPFHDLPSSNGIHVIRPASYSHGEHMIAYGADVLPLGGTITVEYRLFGDGVNTWRPVPKATSKPLSATFWTTIDGLVELIRVIITGISGGSKLFLRVDDLGISGLPIGVLTGLRAMTTQSYIEANVKNGVQFEASARNLAVGAGANIDVVFKTGAKPVLVKLRTINYNGAQVEAHVFKDTVFTAGTGVLVPVYNMNLRNPVASTIEARVGATIANIGTEAGAPTYALGSTGQGQTTLGSYAVSGIERLLDINKNYALRITNPNAVPMDITTYISWYEGDTDLPL